MTGILGPILSEAIRLYTFVVLVNVILSWFVHSSKNMTVRKIYGMTGQFVDPVLDPIRRVLSPMTRGFGIDISPIVLIVFLQVLQKMVIAL
ncbi:MAG: YggT family protein [Candidatus Poribacteria bacterium]|nr:YggT family protein [Candidatus Poribacteria bacterium]